MLTGRIACTTPGPIEMLGTKWPSITSTWIQSAPAASMARISSPNLAKSAERIDGAMMSGRMACLRMPFANTGRAAGQREGGQGPLKAVHYFPLTRQELPAEAAQSATWAEGRIAQKRKCGAGFSADAATGAGLARDGAGQQAPAVAGALRSRVLSWFFAIGPALGALSSVSSLLESAASGIGQAAGNELSALGQYFSSSNDAAAIQAGERRAEQPARQRHAGGADLAARAGHSRHRRRVGPVRQARCRRRRRDQQERIRKRAGPGRRR